jgi:uncharacterized protein YcbK (DUF882 family)
MSFETIRYIIMDKPSKTNSSAGSKRTLAATILSVLAVLLVCHAAIADSPALPLDRKLALYSQRNGEGVEIEYCQDGVYDPEALLVIDRLLRDPFNGDVKAIDPKLLDLLFELRAKVGATGPFTVLCGYRSPGTNAAMRRRNPGVAEQSFHMEGKAVDIRLPGVPLAVLGKAARDMKAGGVGYYPRSGFIHVDVGPVRTW